MNRSKTVLKNSCLLFIFLLLITTLLTSISVSAANEIASGNIGDTAQYKIFDDGTMSVSGNGEIKAFLPEDQQWKDAPSTVTVLSIEDGITKIGDNAFLGLSATTVNVPSSLNVFGEYSLGYTYNGSYSKISGFKIIAEDGSAAMQYAEANGFAFESSASATQGGACGNGALWIFENGELKIYGSGDMESYASPSRVPWAELDITSVVIENGITSIGSNSFSGKNSIISVSIPTTVTKIGVAAFQDCTSLVSVTIPSSVTSIEANAFLRCSLLSDVKFNSGLLSIGDSSFAETAITDLVLPSTAGLVGNRAFQECDNLLTANLSGVSIIGDSAFSGCSSLTKVTLTLKLSRIGISSFEKCSSLTDISFPSSLTEIGDRAFYDCDALRSLVLPSSLLSLGEFAFADCSGLSSVTLGTESSSSALNEIKKGTFEDCTALSYVNVGKSVSLIGERAFNNCISLTSITLHYTVRNIFDKAIGYFYTQSGNSGYYSKIKGITIEISSEEYSAAREYADKNDLVYRSLGKQKYDSGNLTDSAIWSFDLSTGVLNISGSGMIPDYTARNETPWFYYSSLIKSIKVGEGITNIPAFAVGGCPNLKTISISSSVKEIGDYAFSGCGILNLILPSGIESIGNHAFENSPLIDYISIPETLKNIGEAAFKGNDSLKSIYIPDNVEYIGDFAFGFDAENYLYKKFFIQGSADSISQDYAVRNAITFKVNGYSQAIDQQNGASLDFLFTGAGTYKFTFSKVSDSLSDIYFIRDNEYTYVYGLSLTLDGNDTVLEGAAKLVFKLPTGLNAEEISVYYNSTEDGVFTKIPHEISSDGKVTVSVSTLGEIVITNANLSDLCRINVDYRFHDGTEALPSKEYYGTLGAEYFISYEKLDGFDPSVKTLSGKITEKETNLHFTFLKEGTVTGSDTEPVSGDDSGKAVFEGAKTIFVILEIILIIGIIVGVFLLIYINTKRNKQTKKKMSGVAGKKQKADIFSDTIRIPDAPTREIDIQSLFADDPEEDFDAESTEDKKGKTKK